RAGARGDRRRARGAPPRERRRLRRRNLLDERRARLARPRRARRAGDGAHAADRPRRQPRDAGGAARARRPRPREQHQPDLAGRLGGACDCDQDRHRRGARRNGDSAVTSTVETTAEQAPWTPDELVAALRAQGERYHHLHPFHVRMNNGELSREELQRWVANRYMYQVIIPVKDAAILSNCPERDVRREWIQRILDHDGDGTGGGGIESWFRLGEALGVDRETMQSERLVI